MPGVVCVERDAVTRSDLKSLPLLPVGTLKEHPSLTFWSAGISFCFRTLHWQLLDCWWDVEMRQYLSVERSLFINTVNSGRKLKLNYLLLLKTAMVSLILLFKGRILHIALQCQEMAKYMPTIAIFYLILAYKMAPGLLFGKVKGL